MAVASRKGGCGKSVLAATIAVNLAARGYRVALIDADPNGSIADWYTIYNRGGHHLHH